MQLGVNVGFQTSKAKVPLPGAGITYQTIRTITQNYTAPLIVKGESFPNLILVIDEAHTNTIEMVEQLAYIRSII